MKKKFIDIFIAFATITIIMVFGVIVFTGKPVENEEKAIEIAKEYVLKKYNNSFDDYEISAYLNDGAWVVSYGIAPVYDENGEILEATAGGGGPTVKIRKSNGKVISCLLQK